MVTKTEFDFNDDRVMLEWQRSAPLPSSLQRASSRLERARILSSRVTEQLALIRGFHWSNQQRIRQAETRIDQLLTEMTPVSDQSTGVLPAQNASNDLVSNSTSQELVQQLRQQIQQRSELLRRYTHDLKGNFSVIRFAADELTQVQTDDERQQFVDMLQRNIRLSTQLVLELLDLTRLEAGQETPQYTAFDVAQMLSQLVKALQPLAANRGLWLRVRGNQSLLIEGDSNKLHRITQNLLLNAVNYTLAGGVTLSWKSQSIKDRWQLAITDTGPGLSNTSSSSGEGIGLTIVRELCRLVEGDLSVKTSKKGGTQFVLSFPKRYSPIRP